MASNALKRQYIMLKPMATGLSGFARLETEANGILLQLTCKNAAPHAKALRVFLYAGEGSVQELGRAPVNPQGQAMLTVDIPQRQWSFSPSRLQAVLVLSDDREPKPLLLGLCVAQSAGSVLDAKNAMLALCDKLASKTTLVPVGAEPAPREERPSAGRSARALPLPPASPSREPSAGTQPRPLTSAPTHSPSIFLETSAPRQLLQPLPRDTTPQEVFLSAIDPTVYIAAEGERVPLGDRSPRKTEKEDAKDQEEKPAVVFARPADSQAVTRLRPLEWPAKWRELAPHFAGRVPFAPFQAPGWRFVRVPMTRGGSFAIGIHWEGMRVSRIAYAVPGARDQVPPKELSRYRWQQGRDGQGYWVLWQEAK